MIDLQKSLKKIIADPQKHALWLNTLSYLENCGARLIASCEHPTMVKKEVLKHAAEEFRHAYFFKAQIEKVYKKSLKTYQLTELLGRYATKHYLYQLNVLISRFLKNKEIVGNKLKIYGYLLVTYAIEIRAEKIYPQYQKLLKETQSPISILNVIRDETQHLKEIFNEIKNTPVEFFLDDICKIEAKLFSKWAVCIEIDLIEHSLNQTDSLVAECC